MINKHIFEKITGLKPNNDVLNILNNPPYNQNSQNNIKLSLSTISKKTGLATVTLIVLFSIGINNFLPNIFLPPRVSSFQHYYL